MAAIDSAGQELGPHFVRDGSVMEASRNAAVVRVVLLGDVGAGTPARSRSEQNGFADLIQ
jgi:hypothetical protein